MKYALLALLVAGCTPSAPKEAPLSQMRVDVYWGTWKFQNVTQLNHGPDRQGWCSFVDQDGNTNHIHGPFWVKYRHYER
jgi:hypothetical protein